MNNGDPVLIPIACRFVASDQWLTVQLDTSWKISEVKKYILTKVYNRSVADNEHEPSRGRPVSPITFASARDSVDSTFMGSLEDDLNADLDHHFFTESARQPRVRHPPTQRVTSPSVPELPTEQPPAAAATSEAEPGFPPRHYPMLAFSTGQLLEDDFSLAWYRLRPHELLELHPPGTIVRLPREVMLDYVKPYLELDVRALRIVVNNSDKDKDKDSHALGPSCAPPQLPPSSLPLPLDASSSSSSSPTKLRKSRDAAGESRGPSAAAAGAGGGVGGAGGGCGGSPAGAQSMRKRRKTKLEWRDRYLVIRQGMLSLFKSRTDLTPVHTCSLATLTTLRGQEEVVHTTTAAARSPHVVCAKFHVEACSPGSPDLQSSSLPMTEQWNDPWSGGTIAPALETDGNLWRRPESKEDLKQRRSVVEGCERSRGNSVPKEDLLDSRTPDSKPESLRYDLNVGDGTQGIWLVLDTLNEFGYSNLLRVLHRSSPDTINSSLVPSYLLPDSSLPSPSSPSSQLSSYTGTPRGSTCAYPEWRIEVSRRAQKTGLGDVTDAMGWILWGGPPLEPPTSKRSGTELRKKSSQLTTDDSGPHPEPFDLDVDDGGNDEDFELEWDSWVMDLTRQALASASNSIAVTVTEPVPIHPHFPHRIRPIASSSTFSSVSLSDHGPSPSLGRRPSDILLGANMRLLSKDSPALLTAPSVLPFQSTGVTTSTVSVGNVVRTRSLISVDGGRGRGVPRAMEVLSEDISGSIGGGGSGGGGRSTGRSRSGRQKRKCEETLRGALASSAPSPSLAGPTANTITSTVTVHESGGTPSPTLPYHVSPFMEGSPRLAVGVSTSPPSSAAAALVAAAGGGMSETASLASGITTVTTTTTIQLLPRRPSASGDMLNEEAGSSSQKRGDKVGKGKGRDKGKDKEKEEGKSPSRRMAFSPERLVSKLDSALDFVTG